MATLVVPNLQQDPKTNGLYDRDFYSWSLQQAEALRRRDYDAIDWENVIEEIEAMARQERRSWRKFCARAIEHLMKIAYWDHATKGMLQHWTSEVMDFRQKMAVLIMENPGLKGQYDEMFADAWKLGRSMAVKSFQKYDVEHRGGASEQTYRNWDRLLPEECPYRLDQVVAFDAESGRQPRKDIWPPAVATILNARLERNYPILAVTPPTRDP